MSRSGCFQIMNLHAQHTIICSTPTAVRIPMTSIFQSGKDFHPMSHRKHRKNVIQTEKQ